MRRPFQRNQMAAFWAVLTALSLFAARTGFCCDDAPADSHLCACPEDAPSRECRSCCRYVRADQSLMTFRIDLPDISGTCLPAGAQLPACGPAVAPLPITLQPPRATSVRPADPRGPPPFA